MNVPELLGELRTLVGRIMGIVDVLESDIRGTDDRPVT